MIAVEAVQHLESATPELHEHRTPQRTPRTVLFDPVTRDYNVQFAATGQWFHVVKHTDANGVTWYAIKPVVPFEQTKLYTDTLLYANGDTL